MAEKKHMVKTTAARGGMRPALASDGGRPKYNKVVHKKIVDAVRRGRPFGLSGELAGLGKDTIWTWIEKARQRPDDYPQYVQLLNDMEQAKADYADYALAKIEEAADSDPRQWTARAWILERTRPEEFGKRDTVEVSTTAPLVQVNQLILDDPAARNEARAMLQRVAGSQSPEFIELDATEVSDD
ncbi:MAG TPA: hypothetical protein VJ837_05540 [Candidatus Paceibacterota bacterium]|nr:hypothetical protein [Candidatus Paceibacterota bacterium]